MSQFTTPQYPIKIIKNQRISMPDGISLSADLYLPGAPGKFPAVLNYIPYRKDDASVYMGTFCTYLAERGFAGAVVDVRGTGASQGITLDEYTLQEQLDGCVVIDWLSKQPWCNGNVGMWGISYSGFNSIQVAMHNPPALKAIIPMCATDDRYMDDVHYYGGCLIGIEQVLYPAGMVTMNALPTSFDFTEEGWLNSWMRRAENNQPWILNWFRHQVEDAYWRQGSLKRDYSLIKCPVYAVGGWADGYTNPVFRMQENLHVPHKSLVGPWLHGSPNNAMPGPNIDFLNEMCRWWGHWLRGDDTGIMQEPPVAVYIQEGAAPTLFETCMPGKWRFLDRWPAPGVEEHKFYLGAQGCLNKQSLGDNGADAYRYQATVGINAGVWCAVNGTDSLTRDQGADEGRSLTYTGELLADPLEILGAPKAILHVSSSAEIASFCVKINDIFPDGSSRLVCRGILNATHRFGHDQPAALIPGEIVELEIPLKYISWTFQPGHCIRVAISSADFPWVWPSPYPARNQVYWGSRQPSYVILPVVTEPSASTSQADFIPIKKIEPTGHSFYDPPTWQFIQNIVNGNTVLQINNRSQRKEEGSSFSIESDSQAEMGACDEHPEAAFARGCYTYNLVEGDNRTSIAGNTVIKSTATDFQLDIKLKIEQDGQVVIEKEWEESFPRNLV